VEFETLQNNLCLLDITGNDWLMDWLIDYVRVAS
jgi:hypothetical protein